MLKEELLVFRSFEVIQLFLPREFYRDTFKELELYFSFHFKLVLLLFYSSYLFSLFDSSVSLPEFLRDFEITERCLITVGEDFLE